MRSTVTLHARHIANLEIYQLRPLTEQRTRKNTQFSLI